MDGAQLYLYVKIFHIVAVISWMAALFYLPRLFVYHSEYFENTGFCEVVKIQERKLFNAIGTPAMLATLLSGGTLLLLDPGIFKSGMWIHVKLFFIIFLVIFHFLCLYYMKKFAQGQMPASGKFFRFFNEIPTIALVVIITCVVLRF